MNRKPKSYTGHSSSMRIEIKYRALVTEDAKNECACPVSVLREIGDYKHAGATLSVCFPRVIDGIKIVDGGVGFEYDEASQKLFSVATFKVEANPSGDQMRELVQNTTEQMDRGFYGEDGWFADIDKGYYVLLVDPNQKEIMPISVVLTE